MQIVIVDSYDDLSKQAAQIVIQTVWDNPYSVLGLATGNTPLGMYENLVQAYRNKEVSFQDVTSFNLDEYCGLSADNPQSYRFYMDTHFFNSVDINKERTYIPQGDAKCLADACVQYDDLLKQAGGIDLQILGLGHNGHIGFNEPGNNFPVSTHVVELSQSTLQANSALFAPAETMPQQAITMGIAPIMRANKIVVLASGNDKAEIVRKAFTGPVRPEVPASILQLHPNVVVILDNAAAQDYITGVDNA